MTDLTYTGQIALTVHDVGEWIPGESKPVPEALAKALLRRPDFSRTPARKPTAKAAPAKAKTTA